MSRSVGEFVLAALVVVGVFVAAPNSAHAIPAFARRYNTSCQTCHTVYPNLNPFGEAFRRNGYRFPAGADEDREVDEPVPLGQDAQRAGFPHEVWPGVLQRYFPISMHISAGMSVERPDNAEDGAAVNPTPGEDFHVGFGDNEIGFIAAGAFGQHFSFFGHISIDATGSVEVERPFIMITPLEPPKLNFRIGLFEPSLYGFSTHRTMTDRDIGLTTSTLGNNPWAPEPQQLGIESGGVELHRFGWAFGYVTGQARPTAPPRDFYARAEYKVGGMGLDGSGSTGFSRPWQEMSLLFGASIYRGVAGIADPTGTPGNPLFTDHFYRASVDATARLRDVTVTVGAFRQHDTHPIYPTVMTGPPQTFDVLGSGTLYGVLTEVDYVLFPWLVPTVRYEYFSQTLPTSAGMSSVTQGGHRLLFGINTLVRANISVRVLANTRLDGQSAPGNRMELKGVSAVATAAF